MPGGAIGLDGKSWLSSRVDFLIPVLAASVLFRTKYKAIMERLGFLAEIATEVWEKPWNVNCKAVGDGRLALRYLAPYVFRVAISNSRIVKVEPGADGTGRVTFTYRPSGTKTSLRLGACQPRLRSTDRLVLVSGLEVKAIEVDIDRSLEAKPYSKPSANRAIENNQASSAG